MGNRLAGVVAVLLFAIALTLAVPAASAQTLIETPTTQSGITGGQRLTVRGSRCPGGSVIQVLLNDKPLRTEGSVAADGRWDASVSVPVVDVDPTVPEANEFSLSVVCGDLRDSIVVAYKEPLARTGLLGHAPELGIFGALLISVGAMLRHAVRNT